MSPRAERPGFEPGYGIHEDAPPTDEYPWSRAEDLLRDARNYWIGTTRADGRPHVIPVWGIWAEGGFVFGTSPDSVKGRNIKRNPEIVMHLESGDDVVIIEGPVEMTQDPDFLGRIGPVYNEKYDLDMEWKGAFVLRPTKALTWLESEYPKTATRWIFD